MRNCNMPRYDMGRNMTGNLSNQMSGSQNRFMQDANPPCSCDDFPIGMGYVPWQEFRNLYEPERALHAGTIFIELEKPFTGRRSLRR